MGTCGRVSMLRKKMRRRVVILPSSVQRVKRVVHAERIGGGQGVHRQGVLKSAVPGIANAPMSTLVVTPTLAAYAIASEVPRFLSSKVWTERSAFSAASEGALAAIVPVSLTATPLLGEECLAARVGGGGSGERLKDDHGMIGRGGIQLRQTWAGVFP